MDGWMARWLVGWTAGCCGRQARKGDDEFSLGHVHSEKPTEQWGEKYLVIN